MVYSGKVRLLTPAVEVRPDHEWLPHQKNIIWHVLEVGDWFGEQSAINDELNPWTIEVCSKSATVLKIHRSHLYNFFGGTESPPVD